MSLKLAGSRRKPSVPLQPATSAIGRSFRQNRFSAILLLVFGALFYLSRNADPISPISTQTNNSASSLKPAAAPGFENALPSCRVEDLPDDPLMQEFGQNNIRLSRTYEGTGRRVRRMLQRATEGKAIKVGFVGGSVAHGHNTGNPRDPQKWFPPIIGDWFNRTFPGPPHSIDLHAIKPATTALYFSFCIEQHLPADVDLVVVELDVNHHVPSETSLKATESLLRTLINWPSQPAVIYLSVFALSFDDMTHGWRQTMLITQWLDIPTINVRNFAIPDILRDKSSLHKYFHNPANDGLDKRHFNPILHSALGRLTIAYLREQLCLLQRSGPYELPATSGWPDNGLTDVPPRLGLLDRYDETTVRHQPMPRCDAVGSPQHPLQPIQQSGWKIVNHNDKESWEATTIGSRITFALDLVEGVVGLFIWKAAQKEFGQLRCWIDDKDGERESAVAAGYRPNAAASIFDRSDLFTGVAAGQHLLHCEVQQRADVGSTVRILSVVTR